MFPSFIGILDIQSWWEVPSIAHFCSLFRAAFNLLDFDIEELEEALLTDGTEECASSLLTELIVRLLCGCLGNNDISAFNYQMFLRRLFRQKCQETGRYNPFNTDIDFQFLPLRTKVEILYALCDFRLDADDVFELFKNLEAESLRVEPLGWDENSSAYWYFYGTRLYREDYKVKSKGKKRKLKEEKRHRKKDDSSQPEDDTERVWQVVCFTESDWTHLTDKFKGATSRIEKDLYLSLSENFLPEIPRLFQEKERLQRKRLLECVPRRTSTRVQSKNKQKEEEEQKHLEDTQRERQSDTVRTQHKGNPENTMRESRARRREKIRSQSVSSSSPISRSGSREKDVRTKRKKMLDGGELRASPVQAPRPSGRQTNNSLACATGQILIPDVQEQVNPTRKKMKTSQIYELMEEDVQTDMYKVLEQLKSHEDAWPFMDPVEEDYAPNYYSVIRRPMDLQRMEERLDQGYYRNFSMFKNDFNLIVNNCRLYNGQDNEYTEMVDKLEAAFNKLTERYFDRLSSSDDEIAIEYPMQNPSPRKQQPKVEKSAPQESEEPRKRKRVENKGEDSKDSEGWSKKIDKYDRNDRNKIRDGEHKSKKRKIEYDSADSNQFSDDSSHKMSEKVEKKEKKSRLHTKKRKKTKSFKTSKSRKEKRLNKKIRQKRKHSKYNNDEQRVKKKKSSRRLSFESQRSRSSGCSRDDLSKEESVPKKRHQSPEIDFYKDKFDKIKERRRGSSKNNLDPYSDVKSEKTKSNLILPEKDKNLKLKETIEKLKAKSEKNDSPAIYDDMFETKVNSSKKEKKRYDDTDVHVKSDKIINKSTDEYEFIDDIKAEVNDVKIGDHINIPQKKLPKKQSITKNESATEALEQAVKDISKWLDDTPKLTEFSSDSNSPMQIVHSEESISTATKPDDDNSSSQQEKEKGGIVKKDGIKKRLHNKDTTKSLSRRKEVQRTIERLQPGKSKGNLISSIQTCPKQQEDNVIVSVTNKAKEVKSSLIMKTDESSPKLSLGTVLPTVGFGLGKQHNFTHENTTNVVKVEVVDTGTMTCENDDVTGEEITLPPSVIEHVQAPKTEVEQEKPTATAKQCQEKATPNLSAWFKAFGAPKSGGSSKKKSDDAEQEDLIDGKTTSPTDNIKNEQSVDDSLIPEGGDSPIPNLTSGSRLRRTSTGSSISERSSFSQDLDSPRHQPSHPSPLLRSPASPRTEDHQKTYPLMNVTVRVGFYQDTASVKSSPEKSCSPREAPQSPYSAYSQHVYAASGNGSNNTNQPHNMVTEGPCKSPLPNYVQNQPSSFYDTAKGNQPNKSLRQEDYTAFGPDSIYQQPSSPFAGPFSPAQSPYSHHSQHSPYSHVQHSPQTFGQTATVSNVIQSTENRTVVEKSTVFPVKKRTYNDHSSERIQEIDSTNHVKQSVSKVNDKVIVLTGGGGPSMYFDDEKAVTSSTCVVPNNNPSVITLANSKNITKSMQHSYASKLLDTEEVPKFSKFISENIERKAHIASDYSARKGQINDFSLVGLSKSHIESSTSIYQDTGIAKHLSGSTLFSEVKNATEIASKDFSMRSKSIDMINMGYNNKFIENTKVTDINVDMVNMGYLVPDSGNMENKISTHNSKMDSNAEDKGQRSYDLYNMACNIPFSGRAEQMTQGVLKVAPSSEFVDKTKKQVYEKTHSVLQYQNSSIDICRTINNDPLPINVNIRSDTSTKSNYPENMNAIKENVHRSTIVPTYKDWSVETVKKNTDVHNLSAYKDNQSKSDSNKICVSQVGPPAVVSMSQKMISDALNYESTNANDSDESLQRLQSELRIPIIRAIIEISSSIKPENQQPGQAEYSSRSRNVNLNMPVHPTKSGESSFDRNVPLNAGSTYKSQASHPIDPSLRNIPNIPQIMEKYVKDERMLSAYPTPVATSFHDKSMPLAYHKSIHGSVSSSPMFQPVSMPMPFSRETAYSPNIQTSVHNLSIDSVPQETEKKTKSRKKKTNIDSSSVTGSNQSFHSYGSLKSGLSTTTEQAAIALKSTNILPGSAFNFGPPGLTSGLYGDGSSFLEDLRSSSTNQYMAANYMAAAAAAHQRSTPDGGDKCAKPAHQAIPHTSASPYPFLGHPQARPTYPLMGMDPSSALYQQYLHRHQEELLRHSTSQIMGIFPPGYPGSLGVRQPYDPISRPSWL